MSFKTETGIGSAHAFTIIGNLDESFSSFLNEDLYVGCACINGVLQQLLNYRSRPLYHLTCCYLVGNMVWQKMNNICHLLRIAKNG